MSINVGPNWLETHLATSIDRYAVLTLKLKHYPYSHGRQRAGILYQYHHELTHPIMVLILTAQPLKLRVP